MKNLTTKNMGHLQIRFTVQRTIQRIIQQEANICKIGRIQSYFRIKTTIPHVCVFFDCCQNIWAGAKRSNTI